MLFLEEVCSLGDDNLMDEMENGAPDKAPEKVIPSKKVAPKTAKKQPSKASQKQGFQIPEKVDIMWVVALIVAAFVIGFFVRGAIEQPPAMDATLSPMMQDSPGDVSSSQSQSGSGSAPALDESQLNGGQMPSSHPKIDDQGNIVGTPGTSSSGSKSDVPAAGSPEGKSVDVKKDPGSKQ
jgi:hypothetical protein